MLVWVIAASAAWFGVTAWLIRIFGWVDGLAGGFFVIVLAAYVLVELLVGHDED
jgi:hypothetical protein